jgi:hypothetical protein
MMEQVGTIVGVVELAPTEETKKKQSSSSHRTRFASYVSSQHLAVTQNAPAKAPAKPFPSYPQQLPGRIQSLFGIF